MDPGLQRKLFFDYVAQTSPHSLALEPQTAEGIYIDDIHGKRYIDLISGFNVMHLGHRHPVIQKAVMEQVAQYTHIMVYGEYISTPQVQYAHILVQHLPAHLNCIQFTNSGTEATEGALKLAKRISGKTQIACFNKSYHGSTHGALSVMGDEYFRQQFRPLLPGIIRLNFNCLEDLELLTDNTAAIILEPVQAEAGIILPEKEWLVQLQEICLRKNILIIVDEIQTGFKRTGSLWAFEKFLLKPDILLLGKALGGGFPLGAFISSKQNMACLTERPILGHISTFAGHPVSCAAGLAAFKLLLDMEDSLNDVDLKISKIIQNIQSPQIKEIRTCGLWAGIEYQSKEQCAKKIYKALEAGLITDLFIFNNKCLRIAPALNITESQISEINYLLKKIHE
ncbi:MAG: aspartate aminotransferase family protein [Sediminibacterium sp.]|nr:aspartate aminotransferase family protein [Sediminibacterium sp.]